MTNPNVTVTPAAVFAGRAVFTVDNGRGTHYTFKICASKDADRPETFFAKLLTGPDNTSDYTYLGILTHSGEVRTTKASRFSADSQPVRVLGWAVRNLLDGRGFPAGYTCRHDGHCSRCGRTLTHPESLETGLGPVCAELAAS